jgi:hypothetical protein
MWSSPQVRAVMRSPCAMHRCSCSSSSTSRWGTHHGRVPTTAAAAAEALKLFVDSFAFVKGDLEDRSTTFDPTP